MKTNSWSCAKLVYVNTHINVNFIKRLQYREGLQILSPLSWTDGDSLVLFHLSKLQHNNFLLFVKLFQCGTIFLCL